MREVTSVGALEKIVGSPNPAILLKSVDTLDDGCLAVLAHAPVAWLGLRDPEPCTTLMGGSPGFIRAESPTRVSFDLPSGTRRPEPGGNVSLIALLPGIGETLRINGIVAEPSGMAVTMGVQEAFVHCAKCMLRSRLWKNDRADVRDPSSEQNDPVAAFLATSPFIAVSSWGEDGSADTSPKGDHPGFVRVLDDRTLLIPDRRGNRRTDTFRNVLACDQVSLGALVPGRDEVLHVSGTASITDEPDLLEPMAVGGKPPHAALVVQMNTAEIVPNQALRSARLWDPSTHVDPSAVPDLMRLAAQHLARNKAHGVKASMARIVGKGISATSPQLMRRSIDNGYARQLKNEGY
jgi:uncharacterized protein